MEQLIQYLSNAPVATLSALGLLLIIGAIIGGDINLGIVNIPKIETKQAKLLGALGVLLILAGAVIAWKPWERPEANNPPVAENDFKEILEGETAIINVLRIVKDPDDDPLTITIVDAPETGMTNIVDSSQAIQYRSDKNTTGEFKITYAASDGELKDTAQVTVKVKALPPKIVTIQGKLMDVFGKKLKPREYPVQVKNNTRSSISVSTVGEFSLSGPENTVGQIFIEKDTSLVDLNDAPPTIKIAEYDPVDSIHFFFCKNYIGLKPVDIFHDWSNIRFDELEEFEEKESDGKTFKYGRLYCGLRIYGSDSDQFTSMGERGELLFKIVRIDGDKIEYDIPPIAAGSNQNGWRSHLNKLLLRGKYEMFVRSKNGTPLNAVKYVEFTIK